MAKKEKDLRCKACDAFLSKYNTNTNGLCSPCNSSVNLSQVSVDRYDSKGRLRMSKDQRERETILLAKRLGVRNVNPTN